MRGGTRGHARRLPRRKSLLARLALFLILPVGFLTGPLWSGVGPASAADALTFDAPVQALDFGEPSSFSGVSCSDATNCVAVGGEQRVTETNGTWGSPVTIQEDTSADAPSAYQPDNAVAVSCFNSINCTLVGRDSDRQPYQETEYNGFWEPAVEEPVGDPDDAGFDDVSCSALYNCTAIGYNDALGGGGSLSDTTTSYGTWNSTNWLPNSSTGQSYGISCVDPTDCTAVGFLGAFSPPQVFGYDVETNGVWAPAGEPPNDELGEFAGVSCTSPQDCTAVGSTEADGSPTDDPVYDTETNGVWGPITVVNGSLGGSGSFASVSCVDASDCVAVGTDGNGQPIYAVDSGGVWGTVNEDTGATGGGGEFSSVSCTSLGVCTAVGGDRAGNPIYAVTSATVTTPAPPPGPSTFSTSVVGSTSVTVSWGNVVPVELARSGTDANGTGPWNTGVLANAPSSGTFTFQYLIPGDTYTFTLTESNGATLTAQATIPAPTPIPTPPIVTSPTTTTGHGYWLVGSDGGIFTFGDAQFYGSTGALHLNRPVVGITPTSDDGGYWLVASDGGIFSFGDTQFYGSLPGEGFYPAGSGAPHSLNAPIVGMVPSADGGGYFMVGADGGVFTFGDAKFEGSCPGIGGCSGTAVAVMPNASGNGYWLVTNTGNVYTFGDAQYFGAPGNVGSPVTSAVRTPDGGGYWVLLADGVVAPYGNAANRGSVAGYVSSANPATAIFTDSDGGGYWVSSANGSVFTLGDAPYLGGVANLHLNGTIIAATGW